MRDLKSYLSKVKCLECGHEMDFYPGLYTCHACKGAWLDAQYNYDYVAKAWQNGLKCKENSLWRYLELLPVMNTQKIVSMGEGRTSLIRAIKTERRLGHPNIFIKDERLSPTSSFKDRQAAVAVTVLTEAGIKELVLASTGNAAVAYAAYCARADIKAWIFLTSLVPVPKMREASLYGAEVVEVAATYDETKKVAADFAKRRGIHLDQGVKAIPGKESMKTIAYEIAEDLAYLLDDSPPNGAWRAPDWYIQAVSGGIGPVGTLKGFEELFCMGLIDRVPKIGVVQVTGCAPMVRAFAAGKPKADSVIPETQITILSTGNPGMSYEILYQANKKYGGYMIAVTDKEAFTAMHVYAETEGYSVELATSVAFAGLDKLVQQRIIKSDEIVVLSCSGHTFPVDEHIVDEEGALDVRLARSD